MPSAQGQKPSRRVPTERYSERDMRFEVLGPLQATSDGKLLALGPPQQQKLVAVLVAAPNRPVTTDVLIHEIWGEEPPRTARHLIHVYISRLRSILEDTGDVLRIERTGSSYTAHIHPGELDSDDLSALVSKSSVIRARPGCRCETTRRSNIALARKTVRRSRRRLRPPPCGIVEAHRDVPEGAGRSHRSRSRTRRSRRPRRRARTTHHRLSLP